MPYAAAGAKSDGKRCPRARFVPRAVVLRDEKGKPYVELHNKAAEIAKEKNVKSIFVSITDEDDVAVAFAVAEG